MKTIALSLILVAVLGLAIAFVRWMTKWVAMEALYSRNADAAHDEMSQCSCRGVSTSIGHMRIAMAIEIYPSTLWLKPAFPMSVGMRPVAIPWKDIAGASVQKRWFGNVTTLKLAKTEITLHVRGRAGKRIFDVIDG